MNLFNYFKSKSKGVTPAQLIEKKELISTEIKSLWIKLYKNNVMKIGYAKTFNLDEIYKQIVKKEKELVEIKLSIQAVNMGFTSVSQFPKNCAYSNIYWLQQLKERKVKLEKLPTKKEENETTVLTKKFTEKEITQINLELAKLQKRIDLFNETIIA